MRLILIMLAVLAVLVICGCEEFREIPEKELPSVIVFDNRSYVDSGEYYEHGLKETPVYVGIYKDAYLFKYNDNDLELFVSSERFPSFYKIYSIVYECEKDENCVAATCCHASECVPAYKAPDCKGIYCTTECVPGTMDCGQGRCACINGICTAVFS